MYSGYGLVMGGALGLLVGTLFAFEEWLAPSIGAAIGLIVGSVVDALRVKDQERP
jgi:uncharacterized membrane protein